MIDNDTDPRAAIRRLIGKDAAFVANNLHALFARTAEDLAASGIDVVEVANAAFYVSCSLQQRILGSAAWIEALRDLADLYERHLIAASQKKNAVN